MNLFLLPEGGKLTEQECLAVAPQLAARLAVIAEGRVLADGEWPPAMWVQHVLGNPTVFALVEAILLHMGKPMRKNAYGRFTLSGCYCLLCVEHELFEPQAVVELAE